MISIIVPTRNRPATLPATLRTCLDQDFADFEVVVFDNASDASTADAVAEFDDVRLRYVRQSSALPMTSSWNAALSHATGRWVMFIGDDDGLCPGALRVLAEHIADFPSIRSIRWLWGGYTWPNIEPAEESNRILVPLFQNTKIVNSRERLLEMLHAPGGPLVPHTYHALIHQDVIAQVLGTGSYFEGPYPDVASGAFAAMVTDEFLEIGQPLSFLGYSAASTTLAQRSGDTSTATATEFDHLNDGEDLHAHPGLPDAIDLSPITYWDAVFRARDRFAPDDPELHLDALTICQTALDSISLHGDRRSRQVSAVLEWWERNQESSASSIRLPGEDGSIDHETLIDKPGIYNNGVVVDGDPLSIDNAAAAARIIGSVVDLKPAFERVARQHAQLIVDRQIQHESLVDQIDRQALIIHRLNEKVQQLTTEAKSLRKQVKAAESTRGARIARWARRHSPLRTYQKSR